MLLSTATIAVTILILMVYICVSTGLRLASTSRQTARQKLQSLSSLGFNHNQNHYRSGCKALDMIATSTSKDTILLFADKFIDAWKKALCKGEVDSLYELMPSSIPPVTWDNPYVSNSNELKEGID